MNKHKSLVRFFKNTFPDIFALKSSLIGRNRLISYENANDKLPKEATLYSLHGPTSNLITRSGSARRLAILKGAVNAIDKILEESDPSFTSLERTGLEAVILLEGRPALRIVNGAFETPPALWKHLDACRKQIQHSISAVGRLESIRRGISHWHGTGFVIGEGVIATNRHVAELFSLRNRRTWQFIPNVAVSIDFRREYEGNPLQTFGCIEIVGIHKKYDLALISIQGRNQDGLYCSKPLTVSSEPPDTLNSREVYTVGFPGRPSIPSKAIEDIFGGIYGVKRLLPGKIIRLRLLTGKSFCLTHDCSTLGGSSGSCIVDLTTHQVIGLHYSGQHLAENRAVPLWLLGSDPMMKRAGVRFDRRVEL